MKTQINIMVGQPGCGKSTFILNNARNSMDLVASFDRMLGIVAVENNKTYSEAYHTPHLHDLALAKYKDQLSYCKSMIKEHANMIVWVDEVNMTKEDRKYIINCFKDLPNIQFNCFDLSAVSFKKCVERCRARESSGKIIKPEVVSEFCLSYEKPTYDEGFSQIFSLKVNPNESL